jgi:hypothetical protein
VARPRRVTSIRLAEPLAQALSELILKEGLDCEFDGSDYEVLEVGEVDFSNARKSTFFLGLGNERGYRITAEIKVYQSRERPTGGEAHA